MLLDSIFYDESSANWTKDCGYNIMFLRSQERFINELIRQRGYVYLNQIYENLGVKWDPKKDNVCIMYDIVDGIDYVEFDIFESKRNLIMVNINTND